MTESTHTRVQDLIKHLLLPFYHVNRDSPLPVGERRFENDAEHSWALAVLACALIPYLDPDLDPGEVAQYAIVHDLIEVYAGDTSNFATEQDKASKAHREELSFQRIVRQYGRLFPWIVSTIQEYESKRSRATQYVYALDKCLPVYFDLLDQGRYFRERKISLAEYTRQLEPHRRKAHSHPAVGRLYDELREELNQHPEYFYQG